MTTALGKQERSAIARKDFEVGICCWCPQTFKVDFVFSVKSNHIFRSFFVLFFVIRFENKHLCIILERS